MRDAEGETVTESASNDLEREMLEGLPQQRREWVIQRVLWAFPYALLIAIVPDIERILDRRIEAALRRRDKDPRRDGR